MSSTASPCCLVVEDQALIGMALEAYLEEEGFAVAGPFPTSTAALDWMRKDTPEVALLDVVLRDGLCVELARALRERGVPLVVYSGRSFESDSLPEFEGVPWIEKPADRAHLIRALTRLKCAA